MGNIQGFNGSIYLNDSLMKTAHLLIHITEHPEYDNISIWDGNNCTDKISRESAISYLLRHQEININWSVSPDLFEPTTLIIIMN